MKAVHFVLVLGVPILISACGAFVPIQTEESVGHETMERAEKIPVVDSDRAAAMQSLGEVVGYSCKNLLWDPAATPEDATLQVKIAAVQRGASAITGLTCSEGSISLAKNCWQSFTCRAIALR